MAETNLNFDDASRAAVSVPSELLGVAKQQIERLFDVQKDVLQTLEGINHEFFDHARKETELASEYVRQLAGARTIPEATITYREWVSKEMELLAADGRQMVEHGQKIMQASQRFFTNVADVR